MRCVLSRDPPSECDVDAPPCRGLSDVHGWAFFDGPATCFCDCRSQVAFIKQSPEGVSTEGINGNVRVFQLGNRGAASSLHEALASLYCPLLLDGTDMSGLPQRTGDLLSELEASLRSTVRDIAFRT